MQLTAIDWIVVGIYGTITLAIGLYFARRASGSRLEFFLAGRRLPWWLLGTSMVATTFSTDTPNLVTDLVRTGGVSQNWLWWAFVLTGMLTVFFYARLWRRSGVLTDIGFYELRYSGRPAAFLRGFRALYLGVFFNVMIMATVSLAAIKISGILLGVDKYTTLVIAGLVTVIYSMASGLWGVAVTDLLLFVVAMVGSLAAAYFALAQPEVGGLTGLLGHPNVTPHLSLLPDFGDWRTVAAVLIVPLAVQWWSAWYPGSEPGGGGYQAQRMLATRNERDSMLSVLWFNIAHYALRPWPWIIVALASMVVYPDLASIRNAFPNLDPGVIGNDLAYPAMLVFVPHGLLGLVVASLAAAYMSTISTHLNWGASYVVDDFYRRFISPDSDERHYVMVGRVATAALIVLASAVSLWLESAMDAFLILLQIGAGTGLVFILRWFWWRVNAWSEISAMVLSFLVAIYFQFVHEAIGFSAPSATVTLVIGVTITTVGWLLVTFYTAPAAPETLRRFVHEIRPFSAGWVAAVPDAPATKQGEFSSAVAAWFLGCVAIYAALFGTGYFIYGSMVTALACVVVLAVCVAGLVRVVPAIGMSD